MTNESDNRDPEATLQQQIDILRFQLEQEHHRNEKTRIYLERWRTDLQPLHEHRLLSREHATGFAKVAIQTLFLLNGGALIAFPAFAQIAKVDFITQIGWALPSIGAFIIGLILVSVTTLLAYMAMDADAVAVSHKEEFVKLGLNLEHAPDDRKTDLASMRGDEETKRKRFHDLAGRFSIWAVAIWTVSLLAFVVGAVFAAIVLASG